MNTVVLGYSILSMIRRLLIIFLVTLVELLHGDQWQCQSRITMQFCIPVADTTAPWPTARPECFPEKPLRPP